MNDKRIYPDTTLLLSASADGRITSHDSDLIDPDQQWKQTPGIRGFLQQFYEFKQLNMVALTTGQLMKNLGVNVRQGSSKQESLSLVVLDPDADLTDQGVYYLSQNVKHLYLACLHTHPSKTDIPNVTRIIYDHEIDLNDTFQQLFQIHHIKKMLIHSIAPLNSALFDAGLINHLSIIISPILVGDHGTPLLPQSSELTLRTLKLRSVKQFATHYVVLRYDVI